MSILYIRHNLSGIHCCCCIHFFFTILVSVFLGSLIFFPPDVCVLVTVNAVQMKLYIVFGQMDSYICFLVYSFVFQTSY